MQMANPRARLKPGAIEACIRLFEKTNPDLARNEARWHGARMAVDRTSDTITVMALWRTADAYQRLSSSATFVNTMKQFGDLFASPP